MKKPEKKTNEASQKTALESFFSPDNAMESSKTRKSMLLAARIMEGVKKQHMNKLQFAHKIGVQPSVVSKWLSGRHNFTVDTLFEIEEVLSMRLVNYEEETKDPANGRIFILPIGPRSCDNSSGTANLYGTSVSSFEYTTEQYVS